MYSINQITAKEAWERKVLCGKRTQVPILTKMIKQEQEKQKTTPDCLNSGFWTKRAAALSHKTSFPMRKPTANEQSKPLPNWGNYYWRHQELRSHSPGPCFGQSDWGIILHLRRVFNVCWLTTVFVPHTATLSDWKDVKVRWGTNFWSQPYSDSRIHTPCPPGQHWP